MRVYLAGPITGLTYDGATDWRQYAINWLDKKNIIGVSPMRGKNYLRNLQSISGHGRDYIEMSPLSAPAGVLMRDHWDCMRCDLVLANLADAKKVSIGTVMEIAWAHAYRKPLILVLDKNNPHDHMMITQAAGYIVPTLDEALELIAAITQEFIA